MVQRLKALEKSFGQWVDRLLSQFTSVGWQGLLFSLAFFFHGWKCQQNPDEVINREG